MQSQAAREHKPGASRLLLLPLPLPPPPPLPPPALRPRDFSCTTLTAFFPPCPEKCDRSPEEFPRQVWRTERGVGGCAHNGGVGARAAGLLRNPANFPGPFPRTSGCSPDRVRGWDLGWRVLDLQPRASRHLCAVRSVRCLTQTFRLEFSLMCFIWGVRGGGTRRGNWTSREGEGTAREGSRTPFLRLLMRPIPTLFGSVGRMPSPGAPGLSRVDFRRGQDRVVLSGEPEAAGWDGEGAIRLRKDPNRPHTTHYLHGGVPKERLGALAPRCSAYFPGWAGVKGVEGGWDGGAAASCKEAGAGTEGGPF